jgi:hypothetical protein
VCWTCQWLNRPIAAPAPKSTNTRPGSIDATGGAAVINDAQHLTNAATKVDTDADGASAPVADGSGGGQDPPSKAASSNCTPDPHFQRRNKGVRQTPWSPTHREATSNRQQSAPEVGWKTYDSNHIIQDAAVVRITGYNPWAAPVVYLYGPSWAIGSQHYLVTQYQLHATNRGTYGAERDIAKESLRAGGVAERDVEDAMRRADRYFKGQLCLSDGSITRVPGED